MRHHDYQPRGHTLAYFASAKKLRSRRFILDCWRDFTGESRIPEGRQYWMFCGPMAHNGKLYKGCELRQLEAIGLFHASQVVGVELVRTVQRTNLKAVEKTYAPSARPTLVCGDIITVLHDFQRKGRLAPSIVFLDTSNEACKTKALTVLRRCLNVLNHVDGPVMVVWNVISSRIYPRSARYPWDRQDERADAARHCALGRVSGRVSEHLIADSRFREVYRHGWDRHEIPAYRYRGASRHSQTEMTMYVFRRTKKACRDGCRCRALPWFTGVM